MIMTLAIFNIVCRAALVRPRLLVRCNHGLDGLRSDLLWRMARGEAEESIAFLQHAQRRIQQTSGGAVGSILQVLAGIVNFTKATQVILLADDDIIETDRIVAALGSYLVIYAWHLRARTADTDVFVVLHDNEFPAMEATPELVALAHDFENAEEAAGHHNDANDEEYESLERIIDDHLRLLTRCVIADSIASICRASLLQISNRVQRVFAALSVNKLAGRRQLCHHGGQAPCQKQKQLRDCSATCAIPGP